MGKLLYGLNILAAIILLVSFVLPYLPPSEYPTLSLLSLAVSPLILINLVFALYWLIRFKKRFWFSFLILLGAYFHFHAFIEFSSDENPNAFAKHFSILSYNVHLFNSYEKENDAKSVGKSMNTLLGKEQPSIVCIQEYYRKHEVDFKDYSHRYIHFKSEKAPLGHAIFSKYPILKKGSLDFEKTSNNTIWADILIAGDTVRVYNVHLQSMGILPSVEFIQNSGTEKISNRLKDNFAKQQVQMEQLLKHSQEVSYTSILVGDFNNTSFSYVYQKLKDGRLDAFQEQGNGLGSTFLFNGYPLRIDFILPTQQLELIDFKTLEKGFSDHKPIFAVLGWR